MLKESYGVRECRVIQGGRRDERPARHRGCPMRAGPGTGASRCARGRAPGLPDAVLLLFDCADLAFSENPLTS